MAAKPRAQPRRATRQSSDKQQDAVAAKGRARPQASSSVQSTKSKVSTDSVDAAFVKASNRLRRPCTPAQSVQKWSQINPSSCNSGTILAELPRDVFLLIFDSMDPSSQVALSLTSKQMLRATGTECWRHPETLISYVEPMNSGQHPEYIRYQLLHKLAANVDGAMVCEYCMVIHEQAVKPMRLFWPTRFTIRCRGPEGLIDYLPHDVSNGYFLTFWHIESVVQASQDSEPPPNTTIGFLSHDFTVQGEAFDYRLVSSASWIKSNLILKHEHIIQSTRTQAKTASFLNDVLSLPVRLCPHQSTSKGGGKRDSYTTSAKNGPMLTYAIAGVVSGDSEWPNSRSSESRKPTATESEQIARFQEVGQDFVWSCRCCPTKFRVCWHGDGGGSKLGDAARGRLAITTWHCFGKDQFYAHKYWKQMVRRDANNLGPDKRNSEFYMHSRSPPDFECE